MADYRERNGSTQFVEKKSNVGVILGVAALVALVIVLVLFATGFWSASVKNGELPKVNVSAKGGALPDVDVKSKELVVGTSKTTVDVPTVKTEKKSVDVPTIGVKSEGK